MGGSYHSAEMQSEYSGAPNDWNHQKRWKVENELKYLLKQLYLQQDSKSTLKSFEYWIYIEFGTDF